jgi:ABC-2 type transport system ATP-binding protein
VRLGRRTVLENLSVELDQGIVVLAGPNGSGKSTFLRVLATLQRISGGDASVGGLPLRTGRHLREIRRRTGYLAQEPTHHGHLTVTEALAYAAWLKGMPGDQRDRAVAEVVDDLDLRGWADRRVRELSGGTRRRAHLGQAIVHRPAVLLLDEPTNGIDAEHRLEFRALLRRVAGDRLIVMSTHVTEDVELLADRVVVLSAGTLTFDGTPQVLAELGASGGAQTGDDDAGDSTASRPIERGLRAVTRSPR